MPAPADGSPFELVEDGSSRYGSYRGRDRRRIHPRVSVSDRLADARRGAWTAAAVRVVLQATHPMAALLCPLGYLVLEGAGLALVLGYLTALARAASK